MNNLINRTEQIIRPQALACPTHGLLHGNMGLCIFYYHLFRQTRNADCEEIAEKLLDKVFEGLSCTESTDFEWGLAGIGWGIEYLIQNNFVEGDPNEILEEIDDRVFRTLNEDKFESFDLTNGLTGYLFYLISRLRNSANPNSMPQQINRELLILVINKLDETVTPQFHGIAKDMVFDICWRYPLMLSGLMAAYRLNVYNDKIRNTLSQWIMNFETHQPSMHINRIWMATELYRVNAILGSCRLERQIKTLLFSVDLAELKTEIDYDSLNIRHGASGFRLILGHAKNTLPTDMINSDLIQSVFGQVTQKSRLIFEQATQSATKGAWGQPGLIDGLSGIGLTELVCYSNSLQTYTQ